MPTSHKHLAAASSSPSHRSGRFQSLPLSQAPGRLHSPHRSQTTDQLESLDHSPTPAQLYSPHHSHRPDRFQVIISTLIVLLLMVTPFLFTWFNDELFEFNKMVFVYLITSLILGVWISRMIWYKKILFQRSLFDPPILFFVSSQLISTLFSIHPQTSIFGYYSRFHGGLLSTVCYVLVFYATLSNLTAALIPRLLKGTFVSALLITFLAIPEHFGHAITCLAINTSQNPELLGPAQLWQNFNASCWIQDVQSRVFATFGQPNWLAAYAVTLLPVGISLAVTQRPKADQLLYGVTTVLLFVTLLFTKSRSGAVGLLGGLSILLLGGAAIWWRSRQREPKPNRPYVSFSSLAIVTVLFVATGLIFGTPFSPSIQELTKPATSSSSPSAPEPVVDRLSAGGTDSGEIRKIVWDGAIKVWKRYPIFGSGVETFAYSYYQDRPVEHNLVSEWDFLYNKAHNEFLNFLATTGVVGLLGYLSILTALLVLPLYLSARYLARKNIPSSKSTPQETASKPMIAVGVTAGVFALSISNFFGFSTVMASLLLFLLPSFIWLEAHPSWNTTPLQESKRSWPEWLALVTTIILTIILLVSAGKGWLADYWYYQGKQALRAGDISVGIPKLQQAIELTPTQAVFYDEAASDYSQLAVSLIQGGDATSGAILASNAILATEKLIEYNSVNVNFYKTRARVYLTLSQIEPSFFESAVRSLRIAYQLAPTDAKVLYNLALVELSMGKTNEGVAHLEETVRMKANYEAARQSLAQEYEKQQKIEQAKEQYHYILEYIQPQNELAKSRLAALATASATPKKQK